MVKTTTTTSTSTTTTTTTTTTKRHNPRAQEGRGQEQAQVIPTSEALHTIKEQQNHVRTTYFSSWNISWNTEWQWNIRLGQVVAVAIHPESDGDGDGDDEHSFCPNLLNLSALESWDPTLDFINKKSTIPWRPALILGLKQTISKSEATAMTTSEFHVTVQWLYRACEVSSPLQKQLGTWYRRYRPHETRALFPFVILSSNVIANVSPQQILPVQIELLTKSAIKDGIRVDAVRMEPPFNNRIHPDANTNGCMWHIPLYCPKRIADPSQTDTMEPERDDGDIWAELNPKSCHPPTTSSSSSNNNNNNNNNNTPIIPKSLQRAWNQWIALGMHDSFLFQQLIHGYHQERREMEWNEEQQPLQLQLQNGDGQHPNGNLHNDDKENQITNPPTVDPNPTQKRKSAMPLINQSQPKKAKTAPKHVSFATDVTTTAKTEPNQETVKSKGKKLAKTKKTTATTNKSVPIKGKVIQSKLRLPKRQNETMLNRNTKQTRTTTTKTRITKSSKDTVSTATMDTSSTTSTIKTTGRGQQQEGRPTPTRRGSKRLKEVMFIEESTGSCSTGSSIQLEVRPRSKCILATANQRYFYQVDVSIDHGILCQNYTPRNSMWTIHVGSLICLCEEDNLTSSNDPFRVKWSPAQVLAIYQDMSVEKNPWHIIIRWFWRYDALTNKEQSELKQIGKDTVFFDDGDATSNSMVVERNIPGIEYDCSIHAALPSHVRLCSRMGDLQKNWQRVQQSPEDGLPMLTFYCPYYIHGKKVSLINDWTLDYASTLPTLPKTLERGLKSLKKKNLAEGYRQMIGNLDVSSGNQKQDEKTRIASETKKCKTKDEPKDTSFIVERDDEEEASSESNFFEEEASSESNNFSMSEESGTLIPLSSSPLRREWGMQFYEGVELKVMKGDLRQRKLFSRFIGLSSNPRWSGTGIVRMLKS